MSSDNTQPATSEAGNISDVLGSIGATSSESATATATSSEIESSATSVSASSSSSSSSSDEASESNVGNTITNAPAIGSATDTTSIARITDAPSLTSGAIPHLSDLPTLSGYFSYPPPSVPPTQNAPYMQKTDLPEGFVFIIVGAVIAFVAVVIIAWRILTSWSINRRFARYDGPGGARGKVSYTPLSDFKQKPPVASSHDMKDLVGLPKNFSTVPSLFFSPTAEVARHSMRPPNSREATHQHLPAGHYRDASRT